MLSDRRDLSGVDFAGLDLRRALARPGAPYTFHDCSFDGADLRGAQLAEAAFTECRLDRADLGGAMLEQARFERGSASFLKAGRADVTDALFTGVDLANSHWASALLAGTRFEECRLVGARLSAARGIGYVFVRCHLGLADVAGLDFRGQTLDGLNFTEADLSGGDFRDAVLDGCRLAGAELRSARFAGADLRGADLGEVAVDDLPVLRGAVVSERQAAALVAVFGIQVVPLNR
ncbi:pentapeptide repeat-containing protein [Streptacidiphilus sp. 4-A2]|nr:pentapeptide repeat-containing protein [Streptacidiphilus sp. 4-A2]